VLGIGGVLSEYDTIGVVSGVGSGVGKISSNESKKGRPDESKNRTSQVRPDLTIKSSIANWKY